MALPVTLDVDQTVNRLTRSKVMRLCTSLRASGWLVIVSTGALQAVQAGREQTAPATPYVQSDEVKEFRKTAITVSFPSRGLMLHGWIYKPEGTARSRAGLEPRERKAADGPSRARAIFIRATAMSSSSRSGRGTRHRPGHTFRT